MPLQGGSFRIKGFQLKTWDPIGFNWLDLAGVPKVLNDIFMENDDHTQPSALGRLEYEMYGDPRIYLDGSIIHTDQNALPPGWSVTSLNISTGPWSFGSQIFIIMKAAELSTPATRMSLGVDYDVEDFVTVGALYGSLSLGCHVEMLTTGLTASLENPSITGTYAILTWTFSPTSITVPDNIITLSRPEPDDPADDPEKIEAVWIGDKKIEPDDPWVILWTRILIKIKVPPDELNGDDPDITIEIVGTTFSGRVALGTLTVTTADLSGIYQIDADALNDTLYTRSGTITSTTEVAIPSPFFVTYFVDNKETDILHYNATRMRVTGQGSLHQVFQSLDNIQTEELNSLTLLTSSNLNPLCLANFIDQNCCLRVYTDAINEFMSVGQITIFHKKIYTGYPQ